MATGSGASRQHHIVIPIGSDVHHSRDQLLVTKKDVNDSLLQFMERNDVPLESWLDCCMASLESGDLDLFSRYTEKAAVVAQNRHHGSRDKKIDSMNWYLRIRRCVVWGTCTWRSLASLKME
jgi:hypothetical protein